MKAGTVIRLRERLWRVDQVTEDEFAATPLDGRDARRRRFLRAVEEANVSAGSLPPPDPQRLDDAARQDLLLRAHRLCLLHGSAPFLGLQRSRAVPEPYQLVPLLMGLDMSPVRLLIGDDVGIGKTVARAQGEEGRTLGDEGIAAKSGWLDVRQFAQELRRFQDADLMDRAIELVQTGW